VPAPRSICHSSRPEISQKKDRSLAEMVAEAMRDRLAGLPWEERLEVIAGFREEDGIDLGELLPE
jgi:hypothetical protein